MHSCFGLRLGTSLVTSRQVFCGLRSQLSSGTSTNVSTVLSWHSSGPWKIRSRSKPDFQFKTSHLFQYTACATDLNWLFLTSSVTNETSFSVVNVLGCARRLIDGLTLVRALAIANLLYRPVALPHHLLHRLLLERDLALLLKVLLTELLLGGLEEGDVGAVSYTHLTLPTILLV